MSSNRLSDLQNCAQANEWPNAYQQAMSQQRCPQCNALTNTDGIRYPPHLPGCTWNVEQARLTQNQQEWSKPQGWSKSLIILIAIIAVAISASATPISVSGSGSFEISNSARAYALWFSGPDGLTSAGGTCPYMTGCAPSDGFGANIDGVHFSPEFFSFGLGDGGGWLVGFDSTRSQIVMRESLASWVQVTSMNCGPVAGLIAPGDCRGGLVIMGADPQQGQSETQAPEPSAAALMVTGLLIIIGGLLIIIGQRKRL